LRCPLRSPVRWSEAPPKGSYRAGHPYGLDRQCTDVPDSERGRPIAKVRVRLRPETAIWLPVFAVSVAEQTPPVDSLTNRRTVAALAARIKREISIGAFSYRTYFQDSPRMAQPNRLRWNKSFGYSQSCLTAPSDVRAAPDAFSCLRVNVVIPRSKSTLQTGWDAIRHPVLGTENTGEQRRQIRIDIKRGPM